jgi:hypothetical protein
MKKVLGIILVSPVIILLLGLFLAPLFMSINEHHAQPAIIIYSILILVVAFFKGLELLGI